MHAYIDMLHPKFLFTPMCISLDLGCIWPDEVYVDEVYDHTKPSKVIYMLNMHAYISMWLYLVYILQ